MLLRASLIVPGLLLAACTERPSPTDTDGSTATGDTTSAPTTAGPTTTEGPTTEGPTTADPTTAGPTTVDPTTEGVSGDSTASSTAGPDDPSTTSTGTTGSTTEGESTTDPLPPGLCPTACERPQVHQGNLEVEPGTPTEAFTCVSHITGYVHIKGEVGPEALANLARLERVGALQISQNPALTDLAAFSCLRDIDHSLTLFETPALQDISLLGQLHTLRALYLHATGLPALPAFGPDYAGLAFLTLKDNDALVDLDPVAAWPAHPDPDFSIDIEQCDGLKSIAGLADFIADAAPISVGLRFVDLPALTSLAGLETLKNGWLHLESLPLVPDLQPLSGLTSFGWIEMIDLPKIKDLQGLHNLVDLTGLVLGACVNASPDSGGMPGLKDLSGLTKLTSLWSLGIANSDGMTALTGAPALTSIGDLHLVGDDGLTQADVDQLLGQLDASPTFQCFGGWDECSCIVIIPP